MRVTARITGLDAAIEALRSLDRVIARKAVKDGVGDWAKATLAIAKENLKANRSIDTRTLLKSLGWKVKTYTSKKDGSKVVFGVIGPRRDRKGKPAKFRRVVVRRGSKKQSQAWPENYARLVEYGTDPHAIGSGDTLGKAKSKKKRRQTGRLHPGGAPKPFLRPAADATKGLAAGMVARRIDTAIKALQRGS